MSEDSLESKIIEAYARKHGIDVSEAYRILSPILSKKEFKSKLITMLNELGLAAEVLNKLPPEVRTIVGNALVTESMNDGHRKKFDIREFAEDIKEVALMKEIMRAILGDGEDPKYNELKAMIERLAKENEELRRRLEEKKQREMFEDLKKTLQEVIGGIKKEVDSVKEEIKRIKSEVEVVKKVGVPQKSDVFDAIDVLAEKVEKAKSVLSKLGFEVISPSELREMLKGELQNASTQQQSRSSPIDKALKVMIEEFAKDPGKFMDNLAKFVDVIAKIASRARSMTPSSQQSASKLSSMPSLSKYLPSGGGEGGGGKGKGGA